jgi:hypothetical protein
MVINEAAKASQRALLSVFHQYVILSGMGRFGSLLTREGVRVTKREQRECISASKI